jgi:hypothetical protein
MGRPRKICDETNIIDLASKGRTLKEIAAYCDVSEDTIERNYADAVRKGHVLRDGSIRSRQFQVAMKGDTRMLIWLGQQLLGQKTKNEDSPPKAIDYGNLPVSSGLESRTVN